MNRRETERILAAIRQAKDAGARVAIATVVRVKGSAYRREGARIAIREDGSYECLLSGGCLEPAVADAAARVIETGEAVVLDYDLAEDSVWGLGIGCSGAVDVRIERVEDDALTLTWLGALERGEAAVLVTPLATAGARTEVRAHEERLLVRETGDMVGSLGDARLDAAASGTALERLRAASPLAGSEHVLGVELFFEVSTPPPELVIFGAGPDAVPLARQARDVGFTVTVVDVRDAMLTPERFPGATLHSAHHSRFADAVPLTARSHVVVMNHHFERDQHSLEYALRSDAAYVGVLGPRSRYARLLERIREEGTVLPAERLARVRNPVGLALGAETPEEVAVSIVGELIALERGFDGGFLAGRETSVHRSLRLGSGQADATSALARS